MGCTLLLAGLVVLRVQMTDDLQNFLGDVTESRPGAARTEEYPLLSIEVAFAVAFIMYPGVVVGLRWLLQGSDYSTDAAWLRWCVRSCTAS